MSDTKSFYGCAATVVGLLNYIAADAGDGLNGDFYEIVADDSDGRETSGEISVTGLMAEASEIIERQKYEIERLHKDFESAAYGVGIATLNGEDIKYEALDMAKDIYHFVRMQSGGDEGLEKCVESAKAFIEKHGN